MSIDQIITLIIAIIGSGGISAIISAFVTVRKTESEIRRLNEETDTIDIENRIKYDNHLQRQVILLTETYQKEFENHRREIDELRRQNELLRQQVGVLSAQIDQLMGWVVYDSMQYQNWLENELTRLDPNIVFPEVIKPPTFLKEFMNKHKHTGNHTS